MSEPPDLRWSDADVARLKEEWERERERERLTAEAATATAAISELRLALATKVDQSELANLIDQQFHAHGVISREWFSSLWGRAVLIGPGILLLLAIWNTVVSPILTAIMKR